MKELTREEIDERLKILRETKDKIESNECLRPAMACCYVMRLKEPKRYKLTLLCSHCNRYYGSNREEIKEIIVNDETLEDILYFYDPETILKICYIPDSFPGYQEWRERGGDRNIPSYLRKLRGDKLSDNDKEVNLSIERYEEEKNKFLEDKRYEVESENNKFKDRLKKRDSLIYKFRKLGLDAKLEYCCEECSNDTEKTKHFEVCVKTKNENSWHTSIPYIFENEENPTTSFEYEMVLRFLKNKKETVDLVKLLDEIYNGIFREDNIRFYENEDKLDFSKIENLTEEKAFEIIEKDIKRILEKREKLQHVDNARDKLFGIKLDVSKFKHSYYYPRKKDGLSYSDIYVGGMDENGLRKTKVDKALHKVLGVKIYYTKKEIANNIRVIFEARNMKSSIPLALEILKLKVNSNTDFLTRNEDYLNYLKENINISYIDFCRNLYKYYKEGDVSKEDFSIILARTHNHIDEFIKSKCKTLDEFEKYFAKHQDEILKYIACDEQTKVLYNKFLKGQAIKLNLKNQVQYYKESLSSDDYKLSFEEYLDFMEGINRVFDANIDNDGEYRRW